MAKSRYLEAARVTGTHGVKGMVRLECLMDSPDVLTGLPSLYRRSGEVYSTIHIERASVYKGILLTEFREITSLEEAIPMKGEILYADREDIPVKEGTHFIADMLGLPVIDDISGNVGILENVISPAGRQIYIIKKPDGGEFMLPAVPEFVLDIRTEGDDAGVYIHLIEGMADS